MSETTETTSTSSDPKHPVKVLNHRKNLKCKLSEHHIVERAQRSAYLDGEIEQKRDAMDAALNRAKADAKLAESKIEELESERRRLSLEVREGSTYADVDCQTRFIYATGTVVEVRMDTKPETVIDERAMTERERQLELPEGSKKPEAAASNGSGSGGADIEDPDDDDDSEDDDETEDDSDDDDDTDDDDNPDTDPPTSVPGSADSAVVEDEYDPHAPIGTEQKAPASDFSPNEPQAQHPPRLATQKRQPSGGKGGGSGKGGKASGKGGKAGKGKH